MPRRVGLGGRKLGATSRRGQDGDPAVRIATWNVNSLNVRLPHVLDWLAEHRPDVLMLQETKLTDDRFPVEALLSAGYHAVFSGQKTYNGVAILSREPPADVIDRFPTVTDEQRRTIAATIGGVRVVDLYVVNGHEVGSEKYAYKLEWLHQVTEHLRAELGEHEHVVVAGDFNIAPEDRDVHDPEEWKDSILCSGPERDALATITALGLTDTFRRFEQLERSFSWWDYRAAAFRRDRGLRIDLILASNELARSCTSCRIDRDARARERPSDHAPVVAEFDL